MGLFSSIRSGFNKIGNFVGDTAKKIGSAIGTGAKQVGKFVSDNADTILDVGSYIPIVGDAIDIGRGIADLTRGNVGAGLGQIGLGVAGLIPGVKGIKSAGKLGAKAVARELGKQTLERGAQKLLGGG